MSHYFCYIIILIQLRRAYWAEMIDNRICLSLRLLGIIHTKPVGTLLKICKPPKLACNCEECGCHWLISTMHANKSWGHNTTHPTRNRQSVDKIDQKIIHCLNHFLALVLMVWSILARCVLLYRIFLY